MPPRYVATTRIAGVRRRRPFLPRRQRCRPHRRPGRRQTQSRPCRRPRVRHRLRHRRGSPRARRRRHPLLHPNHLPSPRRRPRPSRVGDRVRAHVPGGIHPDRHGSRRAPAAPRGHDHRAATASAISFDFDSRAHTPDLRKRGHSVSYYFHQSTVRSLRGRSPLFRGAPDDRQRERHRRADIDLAGHGDLSAVRLDNAASPAPVRGRRRRWRGPAAVGAEERREDPRPIAGRCRSRDR